MAVMVEVGGKPHVDRIAMARGRLRLGTGTMEALRENRVPKGDALATAKVAAIQAVKATPSLLPLCHPIPVTGVQVDFELDDGGVDCMVRVSATYPTGVEMEALTGVMAGLLCLWDMVKPLEKDGTGQYPHTRIDSVRVVTKSKSEVS